STGSVAHCAGVGYNPPVTFLDWPAASGSRASLLVRDLATQMPAPTANTRIRTMRTCTRAGSARAQDCGRSRSLDTWLPTSGRRRYRLISALYIGGILSYHKHTMPG